MAHSSTSPKPLVFVGSTTEKLMIAEAVQRNLQFKCEIMVWSQGVFDPGKTALESLINAVKKFGYDFAIFIVTADDLLDSRGNQFNSPRDNIIFEIGMFIGMLSKDRVFMITDAAVSVKIPSDLTGIIPANFTPPTRGTWDSALGAATSTISNIIDSIGLRPADREENHQPFLQYKTKVKEFDELKIQDRDLRVREKERIGASMGELIVRTKLSKEDIAKFYSEGSLIGLLFSMIISPNEGDMDLINSFFHRITTPFGKHKVLDAIIALLNSENIEKSEMGSIPSILNLYAKGADSDLIKKINQLDKLVSESDIIVKHCISNDNFNLNTFFKVFMGSPRMQAITDIKFGEVVNVEGNFHDDAYDLITDSNGKIVNEIEFVFKNFMQFLLYAHVKCTKAGSNETLQKWIPFKNETFPISQVKGEVEKDYPTPSTTLSDLWKKVTINLKKCVEELWGSEGISYHSLTNMRVRGSGLIAYITLK